jgi:RimJ/RimL family protein N-acetyltransferase
MSPPEILAAPLIVLRRAQPADAQGLYLLARNVEVMRYMDWPMPTDPRDTESHLRKVSADWDAGAEYQWVIIDRNSAECVGTISCRPKGHAADFGYFLARSYWGKGLAMDAASAVVNWLNSQSEILRVWASVDVENMRSRRLLERLDLRLEGILRMATLRPNIGGLPRDTAIYAKTKSVNLAPAAGPTVPQG